MVLLYSLILWVCAVSGCVLAINTRGRLPVPHEYAAFGSLVLGFVGQVALIAYFDRKRRRELADALRTRGFVMNSDDGQQPHPLHYTPGKGQHSFKALYSALGTLGDRPAHIAEYKYTIGHGKGAQHHRRTEFAVDFDADAPLFTVQRRRGVFAASANLHTRDETINKAWRALVGENAQAFEFLSAPGLADCLVAPHKDHEQWAVGAGWVSLTIRRGIKAADVDAGFEDVRKFAEASERS
jgi:hypothetical protein